MGWTVLYIAFGVVALWLLGEVLLQYKARLRWRLVAFCGFLGVVLGVVLPSVPVIALGTVAFALGQIFVTLSFRRGFSTGWALGGKPGTSRRRRGNGGGGMQPLQPVGEGAAVPGAAGPDGYGPHDTPAEGVAHLAEGQGVDGGPDTGQLPGAYPGEIPPEQQPRQPAPAWQQPADAYDTYDEAYTRDATFGAAPPPEPAPPYAEPYAAAAYAPQQGADAYSAYPDGYLGGAGPATGGEYPGYPADAGYPQQTQHGYSHEGQPVSAEHGPSYAPPYATDYAAGYPGGQDGGQWPAEQSGPYYSDTPAGGVWAPPEQDVPAAPGYGYPQPESYQQGEGYDGSGQGSYFGSDQRY